MADSSEEIPPRPRKRCWTQDELEAALKAAVKDIAADPSPRPSVPTYAKNFQLPVERLRTAWKQHKANNRSLSIEQELHLCKRLNRLTRYGGGAKAREEPCSSTRLVEIYACGLLDLMEKNITSEVRYNMASGWAADFLERHPQYSFAGKSGTPAPAGSSHAITYAAEPWLLEDQKHELISILKSHLSLRSDISSTEKFWKAVEKSCRRKIGYDLYWHCPLNEQYYLDACSASGRRRWGATDGVVLGKRKRDARGDAVVPRHVVGAAFTNMLLTISNNDADVDPFFMRRSPPPFPMDCDKSDDEDSGFVDGSESVAVSFGDAQPVSTTASSHAHLKPPGRAPEDSKMQTPGIRSDIALGLVISGSVPQVDRAAKIYNVKADAIRAEWMKIKDRRLAYVPNLNQHQQACLRERLELLVRFGGSIHAAQTKAFPKHDLRDVIIFRYANGILIEDGKFLDTNYVVSRDWAKGWLEGNF